MKRWVMHHVYVNGADDHAELSHAIFFTFSVLNVKRSVLTFIKTERLNYMYIRNGCFD